METIAISALQHYAYCPRQFALIHVEQAWADNFFTAEGNALHERVDMGEPEQRGAVRFERAVLVESEQYGLQGKLDLLEIERQADHSLRYFPVEYKRGKPKTEDWDKIQLCAQALCLEEMLKVQVNEGAIWYWQVRRREAVIIDEHLRAATCAAIAGARTLLEQGHTPAPIADKKRCKACSLIDLCRPEIFGRDHSLQYVAELYRELSV